MKTPNFKLLMKPRLASLLILLTSLLLSAFNARISTAAAQGTRFFRLSGPAATSIIAFNPDGTLVWSNALPDTNYEVQTLSSFNGESNWVDYVQLPVTSNVSTNLIVAFNPPTGMALIPAGSFTMGDTLDGESDAVPTNVYVSAFYMDENLVSYSQWQAVYNWAANHGYGFDNPGAGKSANHPVQTVNWYDCVKWCNARSQQAGLVPVYYTDPNFTQVYTNADTDVVYPNWAANGYRLPTEAEWEKAARGGLIGKRFPWGDTISWSQANYYGDPLSLSSNGYYYDLATAYELDPDFTNGAYPKTSPVDYFPGNGYGLSDMAGNLFEWCWDWYGTPYAGGVDPRGSFSSSTGGRVLRGGSWGDLAEIVRCAFRTGAFAPGSRGFNFGFRCARDL